MAYKATDLSVLAYANAFTFWHYTTPDTSTTVTTAGYFNSAADQVRVGDIIIANMSTGGSMVTKFYVVTANTGTAVTITLYS